MLSSLLLSWTDFSLDADVPQFHLLIYLSHHHWQYPRERNSLEEKFSASAVSLGLWSQSHIGSESAIQGQKQGLHKKMMDLIHFHCLCLKKDFAFWKLNVESFWSDGVLLCQENFPWIFCPESFFPGEVSNPNVLLLSYFAFLTLITHSTDPECRRKPLVAFLGKPQEERAELCSAAIACFCMFPDQ